MALVGVEDLGRRGPGDARPHPQRAYAADAEEQLLAQPVLGVAAVEAVGHVAVVGAVLLDVGVEEEQRHPADVGDEDAGHQVGAVRERDRDGRTAAVGLAEHGQRQLVGVEDGVALLLPAVAVERLLEVAVAVEQAHAHQRDAEVGGRLEVVAGQDAEAAGVLRQHRGDAELGREVGDRARGVLAGLAGVPAVLGEVALEVGVGRVEARPEVVVVDQLVEPLTADRTEEAHRVALDLTPQRRVDRGEDVLRRRVPRPAQVAREDGQGAEGLGKDRTDGESSERSHGRAR